MSNCIHIKNNVLVLSDADVDREGFKTLVSSVVGLKCPPENSVDPKRNYAWWFLSENVVFEPGRVTIHVGEGRSIHTWRDFKGTLALLAEYVRRPRTHVFQVADEYDGFKKYERYTVNLQTGERI